MITIVLLASRQDYLKQVLSSIELLECDQTQTNLLCVVDGNDEMFVKTRNAISGMKFNEKLVVRSELDGTASRVDIPTRRKRIASMHNQARNLIQHDSGFVLSIEDDTTFGRHSLNRLLKPTIAQDHIGIVQGVELGRWGVPYVGAWIADDVYDTTKLVSVENISPVLATQEPSKIDAGGLYFTLIRTSIYKNHEFTSENGLGPDINLGLEARRAGFTNYIVWQAQCSHYSTNMGKVKRLTPDNDSVVVTLTKQKNGKWSVSY